jgi:hypothetical protein
LWLLALPQSLGGSHGDDGVGVEVNQLCRQFIKGRGTAVSVLDLDVLPFDIAEFTKPRKQCIDQMRDASRRDSRADRFSPAAAPAPPAATPPIAAMNSRRFMPSSQAVRIG